MEASNPKQCRDTGLAMVLILLLISHFARTSNLILPAIGMLLMVILWPSFFKPLARLWFGFSNIIGKFGSTIVLTGIFFIIVTPIGMARRALVARPMSSFKNESENRSVFKKREHLFTAKDLEKPY